jgi:hypothetical protein
LGDNCYCVGVVAYKLDRFLVQVGVAKLADAPA